MIKVLAEYLGKSMNEYNTIGASINQWIKDNSIETTIHQSNYPFYDWILEFGTQEDFNLFKLIYSDKLRIYTVKMLTNNLHVL